MSLEAAPGGGQDAAIRLERVGVWRWQAASRMQKVILEDIDWTVSPGERWALLGPNGAGKTTLLTVAGAVDFPSRGTVEILGKQLGRVDVAWLRESIGLVDARVGHRFAPLLTVREVVCTGATSTIGYFEERLDAAARERADELIEVFGLGPVAGRHFTTCSQGERKRALIARALAAAPQLLLLDEPGAGLDLGGRETLLAALGRLAREQPGLALVMTTHHLEELPASTTHALLLRDGRVTAAGEAHAVLSDENLTRCFGLPVTAAYAGGRWSASAP